MQDKTDVLTLYAPLSGKTVDLAKVPDEVFASKMAGDGLAILPSTNILKAPCDGEVINIHSSKHALSLRTKDSYDILIHIGLDTVKFKGQGFTVKVQNGGKVKKGDDLIEFDLDFLSRNAKSTLTEIIVTKSGQEVTVRPFIDKEVRAGEDVIAEVCSADDIASGDVSGSFDSKEGGASLSGTGEGNQNDGSDTADDDIITTWSVPIMTENGLHARPAAKIADSAKKFKAKISLVNDKGERANAKSVVSIMGLNIKQGDNIHLEAQGDDAEEALYTVAPLLDVKEEGDSAIVAAGEDKRDALQEPVVDDEKQPSVDDADNLGRQADKGIKGQDVSDNAKLQSVSDKIAEERNESARTGKVFEETVKGHVKGTAASKGLAVGLSFLYKKTEAEFEEDADNPKEETDKLLAALEKARNQLDELYKKTLANKSSAAQAEIFEAHKEMLQDEVLLEDAFDVINQGKTAAFAWNQVTAKQAEKLLQLDNPVLAARAADLKDVGQRVLSVLSGANTGSLSLPDDAVLIAEDVTPSIIAELGDKKPAGIACVLGSATSHASILAVSMGIPAVVGLPHGILSVPNDTRVILNGTTGDFIVEPDDKQVEQALLERDDEKVKNDAALAKAKEPAQTADGVKIEVGGNISGTDDALETMRLGGDGVGLMRSEFIFLKKDKAPTEAEQTEIYVQAAKAVGKGKKMIVRTLDVGGDKKVSYIAMEKEDNPFLGVRGIRLSFANEEMFRQQIRSILKAAEFTDLHIMFPMISRVKEFIAAKKIVLEEKENTNIKADVKIGLMIEVPAAALMTDVFAEEADFFSIGTNDLTQYTLAMDRGNPALNKIADPLHPAVLRLIKMTADMAHKKGKFVGVCGSLAGNEIAVPVLVGLGVDELSVSPPLIPQVKEAVRRINADEAKKQAELLLKMASATEVRDFLAKK